MFYVDVITVFHIKLFKKVQFPDGLFSQEQVEDVRNTGVLVNLQNWLSLTGTGSSCRLYPSISQDPSPTRSTVVEVFRATSGLPKLLCSREGAIDTR